MAEEIRDDLTSILIEKKRAWDTSMKYNFTLPAELTVTITLDEFRELVQAKGKYDKELSEKSDKIWKMEQTIAELNRENGKLREKIVGFMGANDEEAPVNGEKEA